jgi:biotin carboxylase
MTQRLLIIGGGHPQLTLVEESKKLALHTIVLDNRRSAPGRKIADEVIECDRYDLDGILSVTPGLKLDAVVSGGSDKAVWMMTQCAKACGLPPYIAPDVALMPMQKGAMQAFFKRLHLPIPGSEKVNSLEQALDAARSLEYPVVIKPVDGIGQLGVYRIDNADQLAVLFPETVKASDKGDVLVQEFVEGRELGVNGFVVDGSFRLLTVAHRGASQKADDSFGVALEKRYPAADAIPHEGLIRQIIERASKGLGISNAPIYAQLMLCSSGSDRIKIIEMMPRLGGGEDPRLVHAATGFNIAKATILAALGQPVLEDSVIDTHAQPAVAIKFLTTEPGRISVSGLELARSCDGIAKAEAYFEPGHVLGRLRSSRERVGYVLAVGSTVEEASQRAANATKCIVIQRDETVGDAGVQGRS